MKYCFLSAFILAALFVNAQQSPLNNRIATLADGIEQKVINWRRDIHEHPELGNRETRTSAIVAKHLRSLGIEVKTGVAMTGVVGILKGGKPGPVIALRADMDALPVLERTNLPFASKVKAMYNGSETDVMHACGHDAHTAILMGVAEVLSAIKKDIPGTVKFIFQPAEEGAPAGEKGGAELMIMEGVMESPKVDAVVGLHMDAQVEAGKITYKPDGIMASACDLKITVTGKSAHAASPWFSVDPILVSAQIISNLQSIMARNINVTENGGVVSIGTINGGNRFNIIPEQVVMTGTVRALSKADEKLMYDRIREIATKTAEAFGAKAVVELPARIYNPVTYNNPELTAQLLPSLVKSAGADNVQLMTARTIAEDFSLLAEKAPGLLFFLGGLPKGTDPLKSGPHHTGEFFLDENGFKVGVKALANIAVDYLSKGY